MTHFIERDTGVTDKEAMEMIEISLRQYGDNLSSVLIVPPDITRLNSEAGKLTEMYYDCLKDRCEVDIIPALGTHVPMNDKELTQMFGTTIPKEAFLVHDWRNDVEVIGKVDGAFVNEVSNGIMDCDIEVAVNKLLLNGRYDLILSIGQVVPHEVVGMANYTKNILVGLGGSDMINKSHMLGAFYGMEKIMGKDYSPVRKVFDYVEETLLKDLPICYVLTVTAKENDENQIKGLYIGRERDLFEKAVSRSQKYNINYVDRGLDKVVVFLDPEEFKSTWLGNKSVYRTKLAIKEGGELIVIAKGVDKFGEDKTNDKLIREYGYIGRENVLLKYEEGEKKLIDNLSVAAHLIHGSSDNKFSITYATKKLSKEEVESVNYLYMPYEEAISKYPLDKLKDGFNILEDGEEIYYISNPALGLWIERGR